MNGRRRPDQRWNWLPILVLTSLLISGLACGAGPDPQRPQSAAQELEQDPATPAPAVSPSPSITVPPVARGVNLSPRGFPNTFSEMEDFYREVVNIPDAAVQWNGSWREDVEAGTDAGTVPASAAGLASAARARGLTSVVVFGWRSGSALHISVPQDPTDNWSNQQAHSLYAKMVEEFAAEHKPPYLLLGNENDFYYEQDPDDYTNWVRAYERAYAAVKSASPDTMVGPVFNYEHLAGRGELNAWDTPHWGALEAHNLEFVDVVGLTLYPWFGAATPAEMPQDLLDPLFNRIEGIPLVITETGWPAGNPGGLDVAWQTSEQAQVEYLAALGELLPTDRVRVVSWLFLHPMQDPGGQPVEWKLFSTISLMDEAGSPRPVYEPWLSFTP